MSYRYRNLNTGDEVERPERWPRLDALDNWELIEQPAPEPPKRTRARKAPSPAPDEPGDG